MKKLIYVTTALCLCVATYCDASTKPISIALVGPFNGPYAHYGSQLLSGAMQAINDINAADGINGIPIEIIPLDDQCDPDLAVARADEIIKDTSYKAIIGHVCSAATLATANLYAQEKMLVITPTSTNQQITERNISTLFRISGNDHQQSMVAADFLANKLHSKKVALLHDNELYSKDLADLVAEHLLDYDTSPAMYQAIPRGMRNFTAIIKKLKHLEIDAIYFAGLYPEVAALANALNVLELQIPFLTADGIAIEEFVKEIVEPQNAGSVMLTFGSNPADLISGQKVIQSMQDNKLPTGGYALYAYAAVQVIAEAMRNTNKFDGQSLANWLHYNTVDTVLGKRAWDTNGDIVDNEFAIYTWQANKDHINLVKMLK